MYLSFLVWICLFVAAKGAFSGSSSVLDDNIVFQKSQKKRKKKQRKRHLKSGIVWEALSCAHIFLNEMLQNIVAILLPERTNRALYTPEIKRQWNCLLCSLFSCSLPVYWRWKENKYKILTEINVIVSKRQELFMHICETLLQLFSSCILAEVLYQCSPFNKPNHFHVLLYTYTLPTLSVYFRNFVYSL